MDLRYAYDMAGNPIRVGDEVTGRAECYAYDGYRRLTDAWTPADGNCATAPDQAVLGGPAGFWTSEELDEIGNRTRQDRTTVTGATTSTTSTVFTYPEPGEVRPHAPLSVSATRSVGGTTPTGATTDAGVFSYDEAGNTTTDPELFGTTKSLSWDAEGRLERVIGPAGVSSFTYTADGDRLVRRDPGSTTVYLPGGQELTTTTANGQVRATRYYTAGGTTVAVRTEADDSEAFPFGQVDVVVADPHGTGQLAVNTHTGELVRRHSDPYGNPLDQTGAWPTDRGFLDKPVDATGYTHIGARYYNPAHGRFLSVDPVMDLTDPAQWHAYAYANNNPITYTDPTGLKPQQHDGTCTSICSVWARERHAVRTGQVSCEAIYNSCQPSEDGWVNALAGTFDTLTFGLTREARVALNLILNGEDSDVSVIQHDSVYCEAGSGAAFLALLALPAKVAPKKPPVRTGSNTAQGAASNSMPPFPKELMGGRPTLTSIKASRAVRMCMRA